MQNRLHEIIGEIEFFSCLCATHAYLRTQNAWCFGFKLILVLMYCSYKLNMLLLNECSVRYIYILCTYIISTKIE